MSAQNITVSQRPGVALYDVWINSTHVILSTDELIALHNVVLAALRS
jgi:hypothetical protein